MRPRHAIEEHTSELRLHVEAPTMRALFEEAARALAAISADAAPGAVGDAERVELVARDRDALFVAWLNELVFLTETRKKVFDDVRVERVGDTELVAIARGREAIAARTAVKAATMHGVHIDESADGFAVTVILDV